LDLGDFGIHHRRIPHENTFAIAVIIVKAGASQYSRVPQMAVNAYRI
jgi:hypothetical protein